MTLSLTSNFFGNLRFHGELGRIIGKVKEMKTAHIIKGEF